MNLPPKNIHFKKTSDVISARQKTSTEGKLEMQEEMLSKESGKHVGKSKYAWSV